MSFPRGKLYAYIVTVQMKYKEICTVRLTTKVIPNDKMRHEMGHETGTSRVQPTLLDTHICVTYMCFGATNCNSVESMKWYLLVKQH